MYSEWVTWQYYLVYRTAVGYQMISVMVLYRY